MNHVRHYYVMGKDRCVVGICDNDKRYPDRFTKYSNVTEKLTNHKLPADPRKGEAWIHAVRKGEKILSFLRIRLFAQIILWMETGADPNYSKVC